MASNLSTSRLGLEMNSPGQSVSYQTQSSHPTKRPEADSLGLDLGRREKKHLAQKQAITKEKAAAAHGACKSVARVH